MVAHGEVMGRLVELVEGNRDLLVNRECLRILGYILVEYEEGYVRKMVEESMEMVVKVITMTLRRHKNNEQMVSNALIALVRLIRYDLSKTSPGNLTRCFTYNFIN